MLHPAKYFFGFNNFEIKKKYKLYEALKVYPTSFITCCAIEGSIKASLIAVKIIGHCAVGTNGW